MQDKIIVSYDICDTGYTDVIMAKFSDGTSGEVFEFYPDEISFDETELIGKTVAQAKEIKYQKDLAYLRS